VLHVSVDVWYYYFTIKYKRIMIMNNEQGSQIRCENCKGFGRVILQATVGFEAQEIVEVCNVCHGTGVV
jgi:DnaJ-class molecular chaperone